MIVATLHNSARELGLSALGIAPAIDEVRAVFPWGESVVVVAISYLPPNRPAEDDQPRGLVARVARGADYHTVLRDKLSSLVASIKGEHAGAKLGICVDTVPLPERKLAVLAGAAWRGKNGNVFVEGCGSYVALGEIVTDLKLPVSQSQLPDQCGDCDLCIRACPTGAIVAPGVIDVSKCLSCLTQVAGVVPLELRAAMGNRIYGCDTCQEVCPRNSGITPSTPEFAGIAWPGAYPEIIPLIGLTAAEYRTRVKQSSIGWIGRTRIRRNAAIAAGNLRCEGAISALTALLQDENPILRAHAEWALGEIELGC